METRPQPTTISHAGRKAFAAFALAAALHGAPAWSAEPLPVADFFRHPLFSSAVMSPAGRHVAVTVKGGARGRQGLVLIDVEDPSRSKALAAFVDSDVSEVRWVNDERLVFTLTNEQSPYAEQVGEGLFAVDREGKDVKFLIQRKFAAGPGLSPLHTFATVLHDGSNDVIIRRENFSHTYERIGATLLRLDTITGVATVLAWGGPDFVWGWALDRRGEPRVAVTAYEGKTRLFWKATANAAWTRVWERATYGSQDDDFSPIAVDAGDILYVTQRLGEDDTRSLARVDMSKAEANAVPLLALRGYDFNGTLLFGPQGRLVAVRYLSDARGTHWFDPALKALQEKVDKLLPGTINQIECGQCQDPAVLLVGSWADVQPVVFRLYYTKTGVLTVLGQSRPWVKPQTMARREMQRIAARDGMSFPVHVTRPPGGGPAPTVVLVHGGPYIRGGEWRWDADSQFLASRGYLVIEPEYRGSTGFGDKLFRAGFKQWGLKMQDDIADATQWAIKQGYADPKRICIAGASYGGYATLMGLIRYPDLYRCGVNWVGVTDLDLMYTSRWSDFSDMWKEHGMPVLVGDREKDAAQLAATSPVKLADKLTQPLLMAYGREDRRVPIAHGYILRDAVARHNKSLEWVVYPDEGHGWMLEANTVDFWTRVERFLEKYLKNAP